MRVGFVIGIIVFAAATLTTPAPSAPALSTPPAASPDPTVARLQRLSGPAFDVAFMKALIPVDDETVEMAMTATLYADHPELLRWNQVVVERKNEQIRKLIAWLQEAGTAPAERRAGVATASVKKLRTLRGPALERAYLSLMTTQLNQSVSLARLASSKGSRAEVRDFAAGLVRVESQDTAMIQGWMKQWK
jgi:uncharacterized protein (DUF305 family)